MKFEEAKGPVELKNMFGYESDYSEDSYQSHRQKRSIIPEIPKKAPPTPEKVKSETVLSERPSTPKIEVPKFDRGKLITDYQLPELMSPEPTSSPRGKTNNRKLKVKVLKSSSP